MYLCIPSHPDRVLGVARVQVDPMVSAVLHYASSLYYKAEKDFAEFYKSSLLYLAFVSSDTLEHEYKLVRPSLPGL